MNWSRRLLRRRHLEQHVDDELRDHLDRLAEDHMRAGLSETEARRRARLEFGGVIQVREAVRDQRAWRLVTGLGQDVRLGVRALRSTPIVTAVAILSLALGIGANTAIFSIVNALLLRNLPVKEPDRLVLLSNSPYPGGPDSDYPIWREISQRTQLFDGTIAWSQTRFNLASSGETQFVEGVWANGKAPKALASRPIAYAPARKGLAMKHTDVVDLSTPVGERRGFTETDETRAANHGGALGPRRLLDSRDSGTVP